MKQRPVCEIGNEGRAKGRKKVKKKKEKKRGKKIGTRWQSAGKSWMKCLSICRSIHARCTTEKYGDLFSSRFSIYTRKWETTRGLPNIRHSAIFLSLFFRCMNLSGEGRGGGGVLYRSRLFEMHPPGLHLCRYDFSSYPPRGCGSVYKNIFYFYSWCWIVQ